MSLQRHKGKQQVTVMGSLSICKGSRQVKVDKQEVNLTSLEFNLLYLLMKHSPELLPRASIIKQLFHGAEHKQQVINIHISNLRKKLQHYSSGLSIQAMRGQGYYLVVEKSPL
ncbi:winged helix-turn-helix domain-containing protein [Thalassotalea sp. SU-HH00458]|uniref:winged helix-turn-helix domain-containing protein n=1 Tax=Thalassotalea sp. SU-HH00458 TaxID=3127657 RepID=UPI00310C3908